MAEITAEQVAAAEDNLAKVKKKKDPEAKREAMQALADLRAAYREQEEQAGRRTGLVTAEEN